MAKKNKFYVVWKGHHPGIYASWKACQKEVSGYEGAQFKAFESHEAAKVAFNKSFADYQQQKNSTRYTTAAQEALRKKEVNYHSIAVDAASSGNPGKMEYRGVDTQSGKQLFHQGPFQEGTNNIGEFLALVHGLALLQKKNSTRVIYSDSKIAIGWVYKKKCNTKLKPSAKNKDLLEFVARAEKWLQENTFSTSILKWETKRWGEIPADFGRK